ncbi:MAG: hypothetical protein GKR89_05050 [Candidatus Latescibacteria bacterium]|nr:hypothetical protein [Candidatus Latescibacterota bacterium]
MLRPMDKFRDETALETGGGTRVQELAVVAECDTVEEAWEFARQFGARLNFAQVCGGRFWPYAKFARGYWSSGLCWLTASKLVGGQSSVCLGRGGPSWPTTKWCGTAM